ncbi:MAG: PH domain-containing protein [Lachnospiraceae bacterium]|nr:PH domain-containing protein [Lachnospiraceae bacterium]
MAKKGKRKVEILWKDRKRNFLGLPWSFTRYRLSDDRLFIVKGFLNTREDEVRLYRIVSLTVTRSLWQKLIGTGTIHIDSTDQAMKDFDLTNISQPASVKEQLSELIEKSRHENRVYARENMMSGGPHGRPDPDMFGEFDNEEHMDHYDGFEQDDLDEDDDNH